MTHREIVLMVALTESVKLQSHYAGLLNIYDEGKRLQFADAAAWIERLTQTGTIPQEEESRGHETS
jgi:hypothetical protein